MDDQLVINFNGDRGQGVLLESQLLITSVRRSVENVEPIHVQASNLCRHGCDLILDGRSRKDNRAQVDIGNQSIVSFNEDDENGVLVRGDLTVAATIRPHGGDCTGAFDVASRQQVAL